MNFISQLFSPQVQQDIYDPAGCVSAFFYAAEV
jgi:hypothetical protein